MDTGSHELYHTVLVQYEYRKQKTFLLKDVTFESYPASDRHGTGHHTAGNSTTIQPSGTAVGSLAEVGRTGVGLALRWRRHHLRWRSVDVEEIGGADWNRAPVRRLLHRLPRSEERRVGKECRSRW